MIKRYVRLLVVVAALGVQGAFGNAASTVEEPGPVRTAFAASARIASTAPADADFRSDSDCRDDDGTEFAEDASVCLAADSTSAAVRLRFSAVSLPNLGFLPASQDTPGARLSRAPPLL